MLHKEIYLHTYFFGIGQGIVGELVVQSMTLGATMDLVKKRPPKFCLKHAYSSATMRPASSYLRPHP